MLRVEETVEHRGSSLVSLYVPFYLLLVSDNEQILDSLANDVCALVQLTIASLCMSRPSNVQLQVTVI